jgi:hypothetical protein
MVHTTRLTPTPFRLKFAPATPTARQCLNVVLHFLDRVAEEELPLTNVADLISWLESLPPIAELLACPVFYQQGREFTYDEWDPYPGMLIKRTLEILGAKKSKKKTGVSIADIRFGPEGEMGGPADDGSSASKE